MLAQQPMIQTSMQLGIDAAQAVLLSEGLDYLAPEDGQCFFEAVNTDQEDVIFNDNMTQDNGVILEDMAPEATLADQTVQFADLRKSDQPIVTVHTPLHTPLKHEPTLKVKARPTYEMPDAVVLEVPVVHHNELFIQERTSITIPEKLVQDKSQRNNIPEFIPHDIQAGLELLSQDHKPADKIEPLKPTAFVIPVPTPAPHSAPKAEIKIEKLEKVKTIAMDMAPLKSSEEPPQIKAQIGDLNSPAARRDLPSHHDSLSTSEEKITDLPTQTIAEDVKITPTAHMQKMTVEQLQAPQIVEKQSVHPTPTQQVAVKLVQTASNDETHFKIKIKPHEKVEIEAKLSFDKDGNIKVELKTDSIESLNDLKRDVQHLEKALLQTGFDKHQQSFEFDLKDEPKNQSQTHTKNDEKSSNKEHKQHQRYTNEEHGAAEETHEYSLSQTGLNIEI